MHIFTAVVETRAFTQAADKLDISRAAVSKHVADLEAQLGGRLLNRTTRSVSLTEAGSAYYDRCRQILDDIDDAECLVNGLSSEPRGTLRINAPMSFGTRHFAPLVAGFCARNPRIDVDLTLNDRLIDMVDEGYDLLVRIAHPSDSSLVARRISNSQSVLAASPAYLDRAGRPEVPADLATHQCLRYSYAWSSQNWQLREGEKTFDVAVQGPLTANNGDVLCGAAIAGMGICRLPTFICGEALERGELELVLPGYTPPAEGIYLVYPSKRFLSAKVRQFIDFIVEETTNSDVWDFGMDSTQTAS